MINKKRLLQLFMWSWLLTLPIAVTGAYITYRGSVRFFTFHVRYDSKPQEITYSQAIEYECGRLKQRIRASYFQSSKSNQPLKAIHLFVKTSGLKQLDSHMPQSGYEYIDAKMINQSGVEKVKVKYRGDYARHWGYDKRSIRIKTSKNKLFEGMRAINIQTPKFPPQLNNFLGYRLGVLLGLVSPRTELIELILNGENRGTHILVEQLEELTLRNINLMPGDIYRGEMVGKDRFTNSRSGDLFHSISKWDKMAVNNHYPPENMAPLELLFQLIKTKDLPATQERLTELIDMDAWGKFSAFESLGKTVHFSSTHNWRIYYDPWRQKLVPIIWDPICWSKGWGRASHDSVTFSIIQHDLHKLLFTNGDFIRARNSALNSFFNSENSDAFLEFVSENIILQGEEVFKDPLLFPTNPHEVVSSIQSLQKNINLSFEDIQRRLNGSLSSVTYSVSRNRLIFQLNGSIPLESIALRLSHKLTSSPQATVQFQLGSRQESIDVSNQFVVNKNRLELSGDFLPNLIIENQIGKAFKSRLLSKPGYYEIEFDGLDLEKELVEVTADFGDGFSPAIKDDGISLQPFDTLHFPMATPRQSAPEIWSGVKTFSGYNTFNSPVIIEPDSDILLEAGAVLVFKNKVQALGTKERPIRFIPKTDEQEPWGAVALMGEDANGSALSHCEMSGGSGYKDDLREYSGMLSIHDVKDVSLSDCLFKNNQVVDDMIHVVYADIVFKRCTLLDAKADGLDIDMSNALIEDCLFVGSGNDGVDLMSSNVRIVDSIMRNNGDKGISVGEGTNLFAAQNTIDENLIGVESKDGSVALLFNHVFVENEKSLNAYKKNWQYGDGGYIFVSKSQLLNNEVQATADKDSHIDIYDSFVQKKKDEKRVDFYEVDETEKSVATNKNWLPEELLSKESVANILQETPQTELGRILQDVRGRHRDD